MPLEIAGKEWSVSNSSFVLYCFYDFLRDPVTAIPINYGDIELESKGAQPSRVLRPLN